MTSYEQYLGKRRDERVEAQQLSMGDYVWAVHFVGGWQLIENITHRGSRVEVEVKIEGLWITFGYHDLVTRRAD